MKKNKKIKDKNTTDETIKDLISIIIVLNYLLNKINIIKDELNEELNK